MKPGETRYILEQPGSDKQRYVLSFHAGTTTPKLADARKTYSREQAVLEAQLLYHRMLTCECPPKDLQPYQVRRITKDVPVEPVWRMVTE